MKLSVGHCVCLICASFRLLSGKNLYTNEYVAIKLVSFLLLLYLPSQNVRQNVSNFQKGGSHLESGSVWYDGKESEYSLLLRWYIWVGLNKVVGKN